MKLFFAVLLLWGTQAFSQNNGQPPANNPSRLMYPEFPADDQPEPMTQNSLIFRKFDASLFERAQKEGKPILLIFSKSDCPGCKTQAPTLAKILKDPQYGKIEIFQIDFINQPDLNKRFQVPGWTFLLAFKGSNEVLRAQGLRSPSQLRQFLKALL